MKSPRRRTAGIALGVVLVALFAIVAVAQGLGHPSPSGDEIAVIEGDNGSDQTISREEFDAALERAAIGQELEEPPAPGDPQYELLRDSVLAELLLGAWFRGEAEERGIDAPDTQVDEELERIKEQEFNGNEQRFQRFLEQSGFTEETAREQLELQVLSSEVQADAVSDVPEIAEEEIEAFYTANPEQFEQPETRNVRVIITENQSQAAEAVEELGDDPGPGDWQRVASEYSIDEQTSEQGGLRENVIPGQSEQALDEQMFSAEPGQVVGPFEGEAGFYVIQVEEVNESRTVPLAEATEQIRGTLQSARQQQIAQDFQLDFLAKWTGRTYCADDFRISRCANADPPEAACTEEVAEEEGCPAPAPSITPIEPGTAGDPGGQDPTGAQGPAGKPQGPCGWIDPADQELAERDCRTWNVKPAPPEEEGPGELPPGIQEQLPEGAAPPQGQPGGQPPPPQGQPPPPQE